MGLNSSGKLIDMSKFKPGTVEKNKPIYIG